MRVVCTLDYRMKGKMGVSNLGFDFFVVLRKREFWVNLEKVI